MIRRLLPALLLAAAALPLQAGPIEPPDPALRARLKAAIASTTSFEDRYAAQVWMLDYSLRLARYVPEEPARLEMLRLVHAEAARARLSPELVLAVIHIESKFDRLALSHAGAVGLMQIMPFWLAELGQNGANLFKPATNLRMGCTILRYYLDIERGNLPRALARYNGSLGRTEYSDKVLGVLASHWAPLG